MWRQKAVITISFSLWNALLGVVFIIIRPELSYSYGHWLHDYIDALPHLTVLYVLPVLGPSISMPSETYGFLFYFFWIAIFLPPAVILYYVWRAKERTALLEITVFWGSVYGISVAIAFLFIGLGLWLPFSAA